ncbi:hypothetical protein BJX70DRAFT_401964 [Aspergillus crustosus]
MYFSKVLTLSLLTAVATASPTPQQSSQIVTLRNNFNSFCNSASSQIASLGSQYGNVAGSLGNSNLNNLNNQFQQGGSTLQNACYGIVNGLNQ